MNEIKESRGDFGVNTRQNIYSLNNNSRNSINLNQNKNVITLKLNTENQNRNQIIKKLKEKKGNGEKLSGMDEE